MAEVNPAEISAILKKQLKDFDSSSSLNEIGSVVTVGDGIARAYGHSNAQYGELVEFSNGTQGIVLNLEEDNVGIVNHHSTRKSIILRNIFLRKSSNCPFVWQ